MTQTCYTFWNLFEFVFNAPVSEAQPEDVVGVETQGLHRSQHEHVAYVKLHHSYLFSVEQHWIFNIFTNHLQKKLHD